MPKIKILRDWFILKHTVNKKLFCEIGYLDFTDDFKIEYLINLLNIGNKDIIFTYFEQNGINDIVKNILEKNDKNEIQ